MVFSIHADFAKDKIGGHLFFPGHIASSLGPADIEHQSELETRRSKQILAMHRVARIEFVRFSFQNEKMMIIIKQREAINQTHKTQTKKQ